MQAVQAEHEIEQETNFVDQPARQAEHKQAPSLHLSRLAFHTDRQYSPDEAVQHQYSFHFQTGSTGHLRQTATQHKQGVLPSPCPWTGAWANARGGAIAACACALCATASGCSGTAAAAACWLWPAGLLPLPGLRFFTSFMLGLIAAAFIRLT